MTAVPRPESHIDRFVFITMAVILRGAIARRNRHQMNAEILEAGPIAERLIDAHRLWIDEVHASLACHGGNLFSGKIHSYLTR